jgi:hypothetical protein
MQLCLLCLELLDTIDHTHSRSTTTVAVKSRTLDLKDDGFNPFHPGSSVAQQTRLSGTDNAGLPHHRRLASQGRGIYAQSLRQGPSAVELIGLFLGPPSTPSLSLPSLSRLLVPRPELGTSSALQNGQCGRFHPTWIRCHHRGWSEGLSGAGWGRTITVLPLPLTGRARTGAINILVPGTALRIG